MTSVELDERPEDRILQPTIDQLKSGAEAFCNTPISELEEVAKATSGSDFNGSRCFQLNYIIVILTKLLAISPTANAVLYTTEMAGQDIDWPLGLYLDAQSREGGAQPGDDDAQPGASPGSSIPVWVMTGVVVGSLLGAAVFVLGIGIGLFRRSGGRFSSLLPHASLPQVESATPSKPTHGRQKYVALPQGSMEIVAQHLDS
eukprot:TRINITY_DN1154_c0_g1_i12.p1 TRINITY_DN1154_c0_g1~~TRINITY_DN1154_c0_g1_i12.p1  ORF type:complete len:202 (-),score=25.34 TRINITY_DN1154_c0_g1_i12:364-969(-)